jgi:hypothetical protein
MSLSSKRALVLACLATAIGGCSFKLVVPPPQPSEWPPSPRRGSPEARCTSSPFPPLVDTSAAVVLGGLAILERDAQSRATPIVLGIATIPVIAGAIYGYIVTAECRHYQALYDAP